MAAFYEVCYDGHYSGERYENVDAALERWQQVVADGDYTWANIEWRDGEHEYID